MRRDPVPLEFQGSAQETREGAKISDSKAGANTNNYRPENHRPPHSAWEVGQDADPRSGSVPQREVRRSFLFAGNRSHTARLLSLVALAARKLGLKFSYKKVVLRPTDLYSLSPGQLCIPHYNSS